MHPTDCYLVYLKESITAYWLCNLLLILFHASYWLLSCLSFSCILLAVILFIFKKVLHLIGCVIYYLFCFMPPTDCYLVYLKESITSYWLCNLLLILFHASY